MIELKAYLIKNDSRKTNGVIALLILMKHIAKYISNLNVIAIVTFLTIKISNIYLSQLNGNEKV